MKRDFIHLNAFWCSTIGGILCKFLAKFNKKKVSSVMWKMAHVREMHENCLMIFRITTFQSLCSSYKQDTVTFRQDGKIFFPPKAMHIQNTEITHRNFCLPFFLLHSSSSSVAHVGTHLNASSSQRCTSLHLLCRANWLTSTAKALFWYLGEKASICCS